MSIKDVLKKSFVSSINMAELSVSEILVVLGVTLLLSLYIFFIYRIFTRKTFYNKSFNISLAATALITAAVIITIQSSIVVSLGMVGALSIVRFRAAIKEPIEIVYLFWSIAAGIVIGAGMIPLAVIGSAIIGIILILFANRKIHENPYILILNCQDEKAEDAATKTARTALKRFLVKSKTVNEGGIELTAEVRLTDAATSFVNRLHEIEGVGSVTLVSYNGEYMS